MLDPTDHTQTNRCWQAQGHHIACQDRGHHRKCHHTNSNRHSSKSKHHVFTVRHGIKVDRNSQMGQQWQHTRDHHQRLRHHWRHGHKHGQYPTQCHQAIGANVEDKIGRQSFKAILCGRGFNKSLPLDVRPTSKEAG